MLNKNFLIDSQVCCLIELIAEDDPSYVHFLILDESGYAGY